MPQSYHAAEMEATGPKSETSCPRLMRRCAAALGVTTMGTVGILEVAAARDLVSLPVALEKLRRTSCFLTEELIENALARDATQRRT
jgi:predicted nucleic acid-binding protein